MAQDNQHPSIAASTPVTTTATTAASATAAASGRTAAPAAPSVALPDTANKEPVGSQTAEPGAALDALSHVSPGFAAYRRIAKLAEAVREDDLLRINVELNVVSTTALGALPRIKALRPECVRRLPQHDMTLFDAFEDIVLSLDYTDAAVRASVDQKRQLSVQADALDAVRTQLHNFSTGMAGYGLLPTEPLADIKKEFGYKPMLRDISTLVELLTKNWAKVGGKAPFDLDQLAKISQDVLALRTAIGLKEQSPDGPRDELMRRRRVFTLFRLAIADIRKIAIYLHGEDAVGDIVPAFFNAPAKTSAKGAGSGSGSGSGAGNGSGNGAGLENEEDTDANAASSPLAAAALSAKNRPSGFTVNNPLNLPITSPFEDMPSDAKESA
jgi:hypothetical protein